MAKEVAYNGACCPECDAQPTTPVCTTAGNQVLCLPCATDEDCGTDNAKCLPVVADTYCLPTCLAQACPSGSTCTDELDAEGVCWPDQGWCECIAPRSPTTCQGDNLVYFDSCGAVTQTDFCERGCVDGGGCCVEGTHADGNECVDDPIEPMPDQSEDSVTEDSSEFTAEFEPAPDAVAEITGPVVGPEGTGDSNGGGCSATRQKGQSGLTLVLLAVAMLLWLRTGRSQPALLKHPPVLLAFADANEEAVHRGPT